MAKDKAKQCLRCRNLMTWAAQKVQFGRLRREGFSNEEINAITPRCQKCVTRFLRDEEGGAGSWCQSKSPTAQREAGGAECASQDHCSK